MILWRESQAKHAVSWRFEWHTIDSFIIQNISCENQKESIFTLVHDFKNPSVHLQMTFQFTEISDTGTMTGQVEEMKSGYVGCTPLNEKV